MLKKTIGAAFFLSLLLTAPAQAERIGECYLYSCQEDNSRLSDYGEIEARDRMYESMEDHRSSIIESLDREQAMHDQLIEIEHYGSDLDY